MIHHTMCTQFDDSAHIYITYMKRENIRDLHPYLNHNSISFYLHERYNKNKTFDNTD